MTGIHTHPNDAARFIANRERAQWHDRTLWFVRAKRDKMAESLPEWERLREQASLIKQDTMARLGDLLEEFERNAVARGAVVHWAKDAAEHNEIVLSLLQKHGAKNVVKSKSMLTEECHLNPYLERHGIEVVDTDLGEWIVQLRKEPPSHIVLPAIHTKREEIGELFHEKIGTEKGATDPAYLTEAARQTLRQKFLAADAGITGVNFAVAETGGFVICTNEGNADLGTVLPKLHIACMGIEKLIPRAADLAVFLRLLARSATGQPITTYSSHFHGPQNVVAGLPTEPHGRPTGLPNVGETFGRSVGGVGRPAPNEGRAAPNEERPAPNEGRPAPNEGRAAPNEDVVAGLPTEPHGRPTGLPNVGETFGRSVGGVGRPAPNEERPAPNEGRPAPNEGRPAPNEGGKPVPNEEAPNEGPPNRVSDRELHIVLVDNGRSEILRSEEFRRSLNCIRCGACMNTCPVYRRSGGHSYHNTVPGPIGSILGPSHDVASHSSLPYACSLCGSCTDVCPVKIDLHLQLYTWRNKIAMKGLLPRSKRWAMRLASRVLGNRRLYEWSGRAARFCLPRLPRWMVYHRLNAWGRQRELPELPRRSFREAYRERGRR